MTESQEHKNLKQEAVHLLKGKGYTEGKILVDKKWVYVDMDSYTYRIRIDVYASNGGEFAIECGNFPKWRQQLLEKQFGKANVIHLAYPPRFGKYMLSDLEKGELSHSAAKQFLIDTYINQIYNHFKADPIFDFQEFNETTRPFFDIDNHRSAKEINPDYCDKKETKSRNVWMNFPNSNTLSKDEFRSKIHWGMIYYTRDIVCVTLWLSTRPACEDFLGLSNTTHKKIYEAVNKLPDGFKIRDGNSFWSKSSAPPLDKEWNDPIPCNKLSHEEYENIINNLDNLVRMQKNGLKIGPVLELAKWFGRDQDVPRAVEDLRELFSILLKCETVVDEIAEKIKKIDSWYWYINQHKEWKSLKELYEEKYEEKTTEDDFKKACRLLHKYDEEFNKDKVA